MICPPFLDFPSKIPLLPLKMPDIHFFRVFGHVPLVWTKSYFQSHIWWRHLLVFSWPHFLTNVQDGIWKYSWPYHYSDIWTPILIFQKCQILYFFIFELNTDCPHLVKTFPLILLNVYLSVYWSTRRKAHLWKECIEIYDLALDDAGIIYLGELFQHCWQQALSKSWLY